MFGCGGRSDHKARGLVVGAALVALWTGFAWSQEKDTPSVTEPIDHGERLNQPPVLAPQITPETVIDDRENSATDSNTDAADKAAPPKEPATEPEPVAEAQVDAPSANQVADENKGYPNCEFDDVQECDLAAQQAMAEATRFMNYAAWTGVILTVIGVILIYRTMLYTRTAAKAAGDAVTEAKAGTAAAVLAVKAADAANGSARERDRLELRAYLSAVPMGINRLAGKEFGMGHVAVRNVGKLPARNVAVVVHMEVRDQRSVIFDVPPKLDPTDRVIQPGAEMRQGSKDEIAVALLSQSNNYVFVWGVVYYDDGYGVPRFTRFCHRYNGASHTHPPKLGFVRSTDNLTANAIMDEWERQPIIEPDKARYHEHGNNAD